MKQIFFFFSIFLFIFTGLSWAQVWFSDDFDQDYSRWQLLQGSYDHWSIVDGAIKSQILQSKTMTTLVPYDQWWADVSMPYRVDFLFQSLDIVDKNFVLGVRDINNFYDVHFYSGAIIIEDIRNGVSVKQRVVSYFLPRQVWNRVRIEYDATGFRIYMNGVMMSGSLPHWAPIPMGKFGLKASSGSFNKSSSMFDEIRVSPLLETIPNLKQTDARWASEIYDHADSWSAQPNISRWGCALSSAAMILRFHGFHLLEDGQELQVSSLNQWLKQQVDGYLGNGLLNWLAISRLSRILSQGSSGTLPSLEIKYLQADQTTMLNSLREHLSSSPQIAAGEGHFFVIDAYDDVEWDFRIRDPLYTHQWLRQKTGFESLRLFTPSHTDLSYILLQFPRELSVSLLDELGQTPLDWQEVTEWISGQEESLGEDERLFVYQKPSTQNLSIVLQGANLSFELLSQVQLLVYQTDGQVQLFTLADWLELQPDFRSLEQIIWRLDYQATAASQIEIETVLKDPEEVKIEFLEQLLAKVNAAFANYQLSFYLYYQLQQLLVAVRAHLDYFFVLEQFLDFYRDELSALDLL
jgi:hypothetical protein